MGRDLGLCAQMALILSVKQEVSGCHRQLCVSMTLVCEFRRVQSSHSFLDVHVTLANLVGKFNCISHHCYADDMQLYLSVKPNGMGNIGTLHDCLAAIENWTSLSFLKLNSDKTKVLLFVPNKFVSEMKPCLGPLASNFKTSSH